MKFVAHAVAACALGFTSLIAAAASLEIHTTAAGSGQRLAFAGTATLAPGGTAEAGEATVAVDPGRQYQTLLGIGGAITDASAEVFATLSRGNQERLLKAYYDTQEGIGYSLARTPIHSTDFSSASYTYVVDGDAALETFSVAHDRRYRLPLLRRAIAAAGGHLTTFASPWSAPAFMKTNGSMLDGGKLEPEFADAWARYYVAFIRAYEAEGVPIWGLTVQNEPMATQRWESMTYTPEEERDFLKNHLGPVLAQAGLGDRRVIVWDHNRDQMAERARTIFADPQAARYAWGLGYHWYEAWNGAAPMYANVAAVHREWPDKHLLLTEASIERFDPARLQSFANAERYGAALINDFDNGAEGWTDWNILLDEHGGPNHVGNYCFAPVHANTHTGELVFTPAYWYIGHFSKFIRPGARRVDSSVGGAPLLATAFLNPDRSLAAVVMNRGDRPVAYRLAVGRDAARLTIPAHAIQTLVLR